MAVSQQLIFTHFATFGTGFVIKKASDWLGGKMSVSMEHGWIRFKHFLLHFLPTKTHNEPIFSCIDRGCSTLFINLQDLEPPEEVKTPETFDY